jgi:energy-coupling factor transport system ATP-binding protein
MPTSAAPPARVAAGLHPANAPLPAVHLDSVSYTYPDQAEAALHRIDLWIGRGEMVAIMGPSGAGKTTLAKVINRTIPAFHGGTLDGRVHILGEPMVDQGVADLAGRVGLVAQDFEAQLFSTNVLQEVVFGLEHLGCPAAEMRARAEAALHLVGLDGFAHRDPTTLSGGEKQRLAIAASLVLEPDILVFDEPTTDLDPAGKEEVMTVLAALRARGTTLILIEHEIRAAELADRLILLDRGQIVADEAPATLLSQVARLERHAVRPPELASIAAHLGLAALPASIAAAATELGPWCRAAPVADTGQPAPVRPRREPVVDLESVRFAYEGRPPVFEDVSLTIGRGEFVALLGRNGSGKTTLAKLMNGLQQPTAGHVRLDGRDLRELPLARVAARVGYVFQNPDLQIFADSVGAEVRFGPENIGLDPEACDTRVRETLEAVGLGGVSDEDPFVLSKGERQRLAIAALLALRPEVLILDEPTTGLDHAEHRRVLRLLSQLHREGMAIVVITHTPWVVAEYAERAIVLGDGRLVFDGPVASLLRRHDILGQAHFVPPDSCLLAERIGLDAWNLPGLLAELDAVAGIRR